MIARTWYRAAGFLGSRVVGWRSRLGSPSPRQRRLRLGVLALLAVAATAFAAVGYFHYTVADRRTSDVRRDVAEQAAKLTAGVLTYKADTVDADVRQAKGHLTGQFLDSYTKLTTDTLVPQAKQSHIDARWEVSGASLISAEPDTASVLVFLRGLTTNSTKPDPTYLVSSVRVRVVRPHGQWLIDRMEPL
ncbi:MULTISPECIES: hypothetical protein [Nocardia]|uniref:Mce-associated membrane protein n=1 Tax=Nocardia nova TaxID=37330 RepID=A0A2T2ZCC6_9NOCA|nr:MULTISPECIES: hypothetical protein [Nocardia]MDN2500359.1 hypothetical protein [Nocardia nova]PSR65427.1 hypothetical protein C8259_04665 [Nocardia nova]